MISRVVWYVYREFGQTVMVHGSGYWDLNTGGDHYWVVDVHMDCSAIAGGWFEFKVRLKSFDLSLFFRSRLELLFFFYLSLFIF